MKWRLPVELQLDLAHMVDTALLQVLVPVVQVKQIIVITTTTTFITYNTSYSEKSVHPNLARVDNR